MCDQSERIRVWLNPGAGRGSADELAREFLAEANARGHRAAVLPAGSPETARLAAEAEVAEGLDRLVVIGGDGTLHQAIQVVAGAPVVLGLVPTGSGNDFARALGMGTEPHAAIARALAPSTPIDLLRVGDRYGATVATIGFSVDVTRRAQAIGWPQGPAKYTAATLLELPHMRRFPMTLDLDGQRLDVSPNLLAVANTTMFGGGMRVAPDARPDDGQLDVIVVGPASRATMLRLLSTVRSGHHIRHDAVKMFRGTRLSLGSNEPYEVQADGEILGSTPIEIEIAPRALHMAGVS